MLDTVEAAAQTGQTPSRVMYNNGVQDLLIWEK